ncbi:DNA internalization-related competence protein ComEC/Rec2 [Escherichia coli]|uniref:DNA internalization-related competence protein ComEC/Rec2 n=1 Tax=Escherichia coli TaxID=562 RepID=UPI0006CA6BFD|nr:DNA internalization-related competence protein ComEC/Rec2 [Escherichia coli]EIS6359643.1 DNA internalization-related competence protein ComEC/Rec2 [Escherichia coli]EKA4286997.1 DNA internalization-related competence protein ComEC/Rec2 [Escherichia coli]MBB2436827.1 DNA internalization-related competence protein ComEC/Rec2 [Escherichia coli]HAZ3481064.1 DNA internalization-related competence protein ComEC/Rec2 [Escherichia coli]HDT1848278.1 DNA internalization-related competence protein Com
MKITTVGVCIICGIFPLLILPQLPGTVTLAFLTLFACVLAFIPVKTVRYIALTLLFFVWGILAAKQILWAGETLTGATQDAIVEIIATDGMTTHYGQITHLQGRRIFPAPGLVLYGEYLPQAVCAGQVWSMKLKVRAVHGQLNDGGFDSQRYAIAQHQPLTGRFLQASVIEPNCSLRAQYLASLQTTLQPYMWNAVILGLGMGERLSVPKEIKNIMRDDRSLALLFWGLKSLPEGWINIAERWQWLTFSPWFLLVVWRLNAWRTLPAMCVAVGLLMCLPLWQKPRPDEWQVYMLDVGQGLAMVIARNGKAILYDTGLAWPEGDSGQQLIIPWLHWHNLEPEGVILSHEHLDHRGGLDSILHTWPMLWIRSPLNWEHHQPCVRGEAWQWQGLRFSAHWPLQGSNDKGNNHSCVVKIDDGTNSILLTGDIEAPAEQKMLSRYWQQMQATLLQVPHHGSNTSSSLPLIQRVNGKVALASASRYNAWRLPSSKVKHRYQQQGYKWLDTPHQGQITVNFSAQGWRISSLREQILPRWYHQWFGVPVDNG